MDYERQNFDDLQDDKSFLPKRNDFIQVMKSWTRQPSSILLCALFTLFTLLLLINIIVSQKDLKEINASLEKIKSGITKESTDSNDPKCSPEWTYYNKSCYYYSQEKKSWSDAEKFCEKQNSHLVVITSQEEQDIMVSWSRLRDGFPWIGLSDLEGDWEWVDGTPYESSPKFWGEGQPDDWTGHGRGGGEDCVHMLYAREWGDFHCSAVYPFICEKSTL